MSLQFRLVKDMFSDKMFRRYWFMYKLAKQFVSY